MTSDVLPSLLVGAADICFEHRIWFYWSLNPVAYAQKGLAVNEFKAPRWGEPASFASPHPVSETPHSKQTHILEGECSDVQA